MQADFVKLTKTTDLCYYPNKLVQILMEIFMVWWDEHML